MAEKVTKNKITDSTFIIGGTGVTIHSHREQCTLAVFHKILSRDMEIANRAEKACYDGLYILPYLDWTFGKDHCCHGN